MAKASDNQFPYLHLVPAAAPAAPTAGQRLYLDSGDGNKLKRKNSSGVVSVIEGGGGVPLLARQTYTAGGTVTAITTTSTTMVDADATNLAVSFTVPPSGTVKVRLEALGGGTGGVVAIWGLREGTTTVDEAQVVNNFNVQYFRASVELIITGLTPGASKTYKWGHRKGPGGTDVRIYTGGDASKAIMTVYDASLV